MNGFEQLALGWQCLWHTRREILRIELWGPWLALLLAQALVIALLAFAAHPLVSWFMVPLLRATTMEDIVRYPELFRRLPGLAAEAAVVLGLLLGSLTVGVATRQFADRFRGAPAQAPLAWSEALRRWPALLISALPVALVGLLVQRLPESLSGVRMSSLTRNLLPEIFGAFGILLTALLLYTTALVMIERRGVLVALREVPTTWKRGFLAAFVVVVLVTLVRLPLDRLTLASRVIVDRGIPELAIALALAQATVSAFAGFLMTGAATLVYLTVVADREEDRW